MKELSSAQIDVLRAVKRGCRLARLGQVYRFGAQDAPHPGTIRSLQRWRLLDYAPTEQGVLIITAAGTAALERNPPAIPAPLTASQQRILADMACGWSLVCDRNTHDFELRQGEVPKVQVKAVCFRNAMSLVDHQAITPAEPTSRHLPYRLTATGRTLMQKPEG